MHEAKDFAKKLQEDYAWRLPFDYVKIAFSFDKVKSSKILQS